MKRQFGICNLQVLLGPEVRPMRTVQKEVLPRRRTKRCHDSIIRWATAWLLVVLWLAYLARREQKIRQALNQEI